MTRTTTTIHGSSIVTFPSVYTVVLVYNNGEAVCRCIASLEKITYPNHHLIVIDNASPDGSGPVIRQSFPSHHFITNDRNLGFGRASNVGIRYALGRQADYVLLLNGDMLVEPNFLEPMVTLMECKPKVGLVSGKILHQHDHGLLWYAGGHIDLWRGQLRTPGVRRPDLITINTPYPTKFSSGAMMLIRRNVLVELGLLPEEYFFAVEEWDYSLQVQRHGYEIYVVPEALAYHVAGASHHGHDTIKWHYNFYRNKLIFQRKFLSKLLFWLWYSAFGFYVYLILPYRAGKIHGDRLTAEELTFAARRALADQKGLSPIFEEDLFAFEADLATFRDQKTR